MHIEDFSWIKAILVACTEEQCTLDMEHLEKRMVELRSDKPERLDIPNLRVQLKFIEYGFHQNDLSSPSNIFVF